MTRPWHTTDIGCTHAHALRAIFFNSLSGRGIPTAYPYMHMCVCCMYPNICLVLAFAFGSYCSLSYEQATPSWEFTPSCRRHPSRALASGRQRRVARSARRMRRARWTCGQTFGTHTASPPGRWRRAVFGGDLGTTPAASIWYRTSTRRPPCARGGRARASAVHNEG